MSLLHIFDRNDAIAFIGICLVLFAVWMVFGWPALIALLGVLLIMVGVTSADRRSKK